MAQLRSIKGQKGPEDALLFGYGSGNGGTISVPPGPRRHRVYLGHWWYPQSGYLITPSWSGYPKIRFSRNGIQLWDLGSYQDSSGSDSPTDGSPQGQSFWPWWRQSRRVNGSATTGADLYPINTPAPTGPHGIVMPYSFNDSVALATYQVFLEMTPLEIVEDCDAIEFFNPLIGTAGNWYAGWFYGVISD